MNEVDKFLKHYGVPGMRWGKRSNASPSTGHTGYTKKQKATDAFLLGNAAGKVQKKINEGVSSHDARKQIYTHEVKKAAVISGSMLAVGALTAVGHYGAMALDTAVLAKKKSNGEKAATKLFSDTHGIANYSTIRLSQNPTTGHWV